MPRLTIDLTKIEHNARIVSGLLEPHRVRLTGVTKACLGNALVAEAMLAGGATALADSRPQNISNLRTELPLEQLHMLRPPGEAALPPADIFYVSSLEMAAKLSSGDDVNPTKVCLMLESGDGREGVPPELAPDLAEKIVETDGLELTGLGTNAACARKGISLGDCLGQFYETSARILWRLGKTGLKNRPRPRSNGGGLGRLRPFPLMSIGGSAFLRVFEEPPDASYGRVAGAPGRPKPAQLGAVSEIRCGEALLLGRIPAQDRQDMFVTGAARDAFILEGIVLERYHKNDECQNLLDFGLQDTGGAPLIPREPGIACRYSTSDYLAVSCDPDRPPAIGSRLSFIPTYYALVAAMTSPFVEKVFQGAAEEGDANA